MKKEIKLLNEYFGSYKEAAKALGITPRHYFNVRNGMAGKFLRMRISALAKETVLKNHRK